MLPSIAWANFFNYARYLNLSVVPEVQLIKDAYRNSRNRSQSSIHALNKLLVINNRSNIQVAKRSQVQVQASLYLASLYFSEGRIRKAEGLLSDVQPIVKNIRDKKLQLYFYYQSGMISLSQKKYNKARQFYHAAHDLSSDIDNPLMLALTLQGFGEVQLLSGDSLSALQNFKLAYVGLRNLDQVVLAADAGILYFALLSKNGKIDFTKLKISELIYLVNLTPDEAKRMQQMSELLDIYNSLVVKTVPASVHKIFHQIADDSLRLVGKLKKGQGQLSVTANLVKVYQRDGKYAEALKLVQETLQSTKEKSSFKTLIPLYMQQANLLHLMKDSVESITVNQTVLTLLKKAIFSQDSDDKNKYYNDLVETYDSLINQLFIIQSTLVGNVAIQKNLRQLRDYVEEKNYFKFNVLTNDTYENFTVRKNSVSVLSKKAAIIYPVLYHDRLEILVSLPKTMEIYTQKIPKVDIMRLVAELRHSIERPDKKNDYKKNAMTLYSWLISPIRQDLLKQNVGSLVFVLDKTLAILPTSVLIDKQSRRYLVEQYAIAVSSGLMLTDVSLRRRKRGAVLYLGATSDQQGGSKLIEQEMKNIAATTQVSAHVDSSFNAENLGNIPSVEEYNKIHISAPYSIEPKFINSYVVTNNRKLTLMSMLGVLTQKRELELLVLDGSIATKQTKKSDGRILAIAHAFGSRSVIASLWPKTSDATLLFMSEFYTILSSSSMSVSTAIRRAKMRLIASKKYQHPAHWARFELFGSWL